MNTAHNMEQHQTGLWLTSVMLTVSGHVLHTWAWMLGDGMELLSFVGTIVGIVGGIISMSPSLRAAVDAKFKKWFNL